MKYSKTTYASAKIADIATKTPSQFKKVSRFLLGSVAFFSFCYFASAFAKDVTSITNSNYFSFKTIGLFFKTISPQLIISSISAVIASGTSLFISFISFKNVDFDGNILTNIRQKTKSKDLILVLPVIAGLFLQFNNISLLVNRSLRPSILVESAISFFRRNLVKVLPKNFGDYIMTISREGFTNLFAAVSLPWIISKFQEPKEKTILIKKNDTETIAGKKTEEPPESIFQKNNQVIITNLDQEIEVKSSDAPTNQQEFETINKYFRDSQAELNKVKIELRKRELNFEEYKKQAESYFNQQVELAQKAKESAEAKFAEIQENLEKSQSLAANNFSSQKQLSIENENFKSQISVLKEKIEELLKEKLKEEELCEKLNNIVTKLCKNTDDNKEKAGSSKNFDELLDILEQENHKLFLQSDKLDKENRNYREKIDKLEVQMKLLGDIVEKAAGSLKKSVNNRNPVVINSR